VTRKGTFRGGDLGFAATGLFAKYRIRGEMSSLSLIIVASNLRILSQFLPRVFAFSRLKSISSKAASSENERYLQSENQFLHMVAIFVKSSPFSILLKRSKNPNE